MPTSKYVLGFNEINKTMVFEVGGKGANLGQLSSMPNINVPDGFCITTEAFKTIISKITGFNSLVNSLNNIQASELKKINEISEKIRNVIENAKIDDEITYEIVSKLQTYGINEAYAIRSSATAEDLPTSSFAGQQDTYLNITGKDEILKHIKKCWASLYTDRAVTYRIQNNFDHKKIQLSVVIQKMIFPEASGILFTADPISSSRKIVSIDASFGLGEALVSGLVNSDNYKVQGNKIIEKKISSKKLAIYALNEGGTKEKNIDIKHQDRQALTDEEILQLEKLGREIESYFGCPQDIEWCLSKNKFYIVQSRPITTLYPIPESNDDKNHVYMSFGHQQMMTDAMKPLGLSFFETGFSDSILIKAGGRLFIDLTHDLATPLGRKMAIFAMGKVDPLIQNSLKRIVKRKAFIKSLAKGKKFLSMSSGYFSWSFLINLIKTYRSNDPNLVPALIAQYEQKNKDMELNISSLSGDKLFIFIRESLKQLNVDLQDSLSAVWSGTLALSWLNKNMEKWLGEKSVADTLSKSVSNNITSEMGLALLDVADVARQYPAVIDYFEHVNTCTFYEDMSKLEGGEPTLSSIGNYLKKYGMRCNGEIDITRQRWIEEPTALIPMILSNIKNFEKNAHQTIFKQGLLEANKKEQDLLSSLEKLPNGKQKAKKTKRIISILRNFIGFREYPKYFMIQEYFIIKKALLKEAATLVQKGLIHEKEDIYYLSFNELQEATCKNQLDYEIILKRKAEYETYERLTPPRLITSEGEIISGEYEKSGIPKGAFVGIPASSGVIEGHARVILRMEDAHIKQGDILITKFTDPSWTPIFVSIKALVTEVGGMMTHGSVVAREYGLPAVVGVENATKLILDGQLIRVNGTEGFVEIL